MDLLPFSIRRVEYTRLHRNKQMTVEAMYRQLKILIEHNYYEPVMLMPIFHLNTGRLLQFHAAEAHDFHSVKWQITRFMND